LFAAQRLASDRPKAVPRPANFLIDRSDPGSLGIGGVDQRRVGTHPEKVGQKTVRDLSMGAAQSHSPSIFNFWVPCPLHCVACPI
jgi:hypothetical protein